MAVDYHLEGQVAVITGSTSGIGQALATALAEQGVNVVLNGFGDPAKIEADRLAIQAKTNAAVRYHGADMTKPKEIADLIAYAHREFGRLDILVNNAAFQMSHESLDELTEEEWVHTFNVNMHAQFFMAKAALPHMHEGSSIINTTSVNADKAPPHLIAYSASKGAIANFTASLGQLLAEKGIRVNCVAPGPIWTPLIPSTFPPEKVKEFGKNVPMKRPGQPKEVAPVFVFLASDDASYVTGALYPVTGGTPML